MVSIDKLNISEDKKRILENLLWATGGKVVILLGSLFVGILVARYLGPEQYGLMNYVISLVFLYQVLAVFGLDSIEVREEARGEIPFTTVIGTAFCIKIGLGILTMLGVILTSWLMDADAATTLFVAIHSLSIITNSFGVIRNYFTSIVQNKYVVQSEISRTLIGMGIKVVMLLCHASLIWFVCAFTFDTFLLAGGYYISYRRKVGRISAWTFDMEYAKHLMKESFPLLLTSAAVIVYQRIDQVMIGQMIDKESVGYFSIAVRFVEVLVFVPQMLAHTISPVLVKLREHSPEHYRIKAQQFMNLSLWCTTLLSVLTSVLAYWIILFTFGEQYLVAVPVLQVLSFKAVSVALSNTAGTMIIVEGIQKQVFWRDVFGCIVCVILNYLFLPRYGVMAAAVVAIVSNVAAGYLADALIPAYRHVFVHQTKAMLIGWKDVVHIKSIISNH